MYEKIIPRQMYKIFSGGKHVKGPLAALITMRLQVFYFVCVVNAADLFPDSRSFL